MIDVNNENYDEKCMKALEGIELTENRIIAKRIKIEKSKGGILLVDQEDPDYFSAYAYIVGPGKHDPVTEKLCPMEVEPGMIITCQARAYQPLMIEGEEFCILKSGDIVFLRRDGKVTDIRWK